MLLIFEKQFYSTKTFNTDIPNFFGISTAFLYLQNFSAHAFENSLFSAEK